jgi:hypothetical protein
MVYIIGLQRNTYNKYINEIVFRFNNDIENRFTLNLINSNHRL